MTSGKLVNSGSVTAYPATGWQLGPAGCKLIDRETDAGLIRLRLSLGRWKSVDCAAWQRARAFMHRHR